MLLDPQLCTSTGSHVANQQNGKAWSSYSVMMEVRGCIPFFMWEETGGRRQIKSILIPAKQKFLFFGRSFAATFNLRQNLSEPREKKDFSGF